MNPVEQAVDSIRKELAILDPDLKYGRVPDQFDQGRISGLRAALVFLGETP